MKYQLIILSLCVFVTISQDCNNPLIDKTISGFLTTPVVAAADMKFCPGLAGKEICCDVDIMKEFVQKMKNKNKKFEQSRTKMVKGAEDAINDMDENIETDAEMESEQEEIGLEVLEDSARVLRALRSLQTQNMKSNAKKSGKRAAPKGKGKSRKSDGKKRKKQSKSQRDENMKQAKSKVKKKMNSKQGQNKQKKTDLVKNSKQCFQQLFKFSNGMTCATCDANYASYTSGNTIQVDKSNCDRLKEKCFPFLQTRSEMSEVVKESKMKKKLRKGKLKFDEKKDLVEKCLEKQAEDDTVECSQEMADFDELAEKAAKLSTEDVQTAAGEAPDIIKMPDGCTSATDCDYICTKFVDARGATDEAETQENLEDTSLERILIENRKLTTVNLQFVNGGYQADDDIHSTGELAETITFTETVDTSGFITYQSSIFIFGLIALLFSLFR